MQRVQAGTKSVHVSRGLWAKNIIHTLTINKYITQHKSYWHYSIQMLMIIPNHDEHLERDMRIIYPHARQDFNLMLHAFENRARASATVPIPSLPFPPFSFVHLQRGTCGGVPGGRLPPGEKMWFYRLKVQFESILLVASTWFSSQLYRLKVPDFTGIFTDFTIKCTGSE